MDAKQRRKVKRKIIIALTSKEVANMIIWLASPVDTTDVRTIRYQWNPAKWLMRYFTKYELGEFLKDKGYDSFIINYEPLRSKEQSLANVEGSLIHAATQLKTLCKNIYGVSSLAYGEIRERLPKPTMDLVYVEA